ncbi:unnamed protein product [Pieris macdunnoughi]|uniref:Uncharacterized protein n=1 Tax=Pieris macdunnoughi TaxID=345717 RepID=A0A821SD97_9NEOP|nr:unnamed protein product [Pieris macdunnoughi]
MDRKKKASVGDTSAADHLNVDDVCVTHIKAESLEEPQTTTFFENVYDKSFYDLGIFPNQILSDNEKRQIHIKAFTAFRTFSNKHQPEQ